MSAVRECAEVVAVVGAVTLVSRFLPLSYTAYGQIYLLGVIALSLRVGRWPILFAAAASALAWDYFFVTPRMSFAILSLDDMLLLGTYFVVAIIAGQLATHVRAHGRLNAEAELRQTLLDNVSHELKTPLAVLRSAAEQLDSADPRRREALKEEIVAATGRLDHLVSNLLNETRLESGALAPQVDWCDARDIINGSRRIVGRALEGHPFTAEVPTDMPLFKADPPMLEQALANLIMNAALHTAAGTPVLVASGVESRGYRVFISVSDRGPGLPAELRERPFEKFKGGPPRAGGLGLSIVRGFVVAQGGSVVADVNPGGGARFTIYLPYGVHGSVPSE